MPVDIKCKSCGYNFYTVGSATWNRRGTVTVYPNYGYCASCCGRSYSYPSGSGNVVKLECAACSNIFGKVTWYDWKNYSSISRGYCNGCRSEYQNEQERKRALERAEQKRREEARRLEAEQRRQREAEAERLRIKREAEARAQKEKAERDRKQEIAKLMSKLRAEKTTNDDEKSPPPKNQNIYDEWMKLDTFELVKDIGDRVAAVSAAGQDVVDKVEDIKQSLMQSVKDHYDTIAPEIERYKEYGNEMKRMNNVFIQEFTKAFKSDCVSETMECLNDSDDLKTGDDALQSKVADLLKGPQLANPMDLVAKIQSLQQQYADKKKTFDDKMDQRMVKLDQAIANIEGKLSVMEGYYDEMIADNERFIQFCVGQGDKYGDEMKDIKEYLSGVINQVKGKSRDLYEGQDEDVERKTFTEEYTVYTRAQQNSKPSNAQRSSVPLGGALPMIGAFAGAVGGALIGNVIMPGAGTLPGLVIGGVLGGMIGLWVEGSFEKDKESGVEMKAHTEKIELTGQDYYSGSEHSGALKQITKALESKIKEYKDDLLSGENAAQKNIDESKDFKMGIAAIRTQVLIFKKDIEGFKTVMKEAVNNPQYRKTMNQKCKDLFTKIWDLVLEIENKSKEKSPSVTV
eukprot:258072_1